jgi:hypothetical protein
MHSLMVQVEVLVGAWLMHLFMVQVDYRFFGIGWYRLAGCRLIGIGCYNNISHSDSVTVVPSFYFYVRVVGRGKDRWL